MGTCLDGKSRLHTHRFTLASLGLTVALLVGCSLDVKPTDSDDDGSSSTTTENGPTTTSLSTSGPTTSSGPSTSGQGGAPTTTTATTTTSAGGASQGCSVHTDCNADQICIGAQCNLAWGREYVFHTMSADIPGSNPYTGTAWDSLGGAPDPFVRVSEGGVAVGDTSIIDDTFAPSWTEQVTFVLHENGGEIEFLVLDDDIGTDPDYVGGIAGIPIVWLNAVRFDNGVSELTVEGVTFTLQVDPL